MQYIFEVSIWILKSNKMAKNPVKAFTLDEMKDKYVGKKGSAKREAYEYELRMDVLGFMIKKARQEHDAFTDKQSANGDRTEPQRLKQSDFTTATDGQKIMRAYGFADGHSEIHAASSLQELTAWENEHIIPRGGQSVRP